MRHKRGQELSLQIIIVAIIVLVVLVVLIFIFTGQIGKFRGGADATKENICYQKQGYRCVQNIEDCADRSAKKGEYPECGREGYCCKPK